VSVRFGAFTLDVDQRRLLRDDVDLHLTPKAFDLLALLIQQAPRVVPKAELHERLWPGTFVSDATLVGLVKEVRRVLGADGQPSPLVRTAHRVGYGFSGVVERATQSPTPLATHWVVAGSRRIPLSDGENLIGRDPAATVWLDVAGVSRRHACIRITPGSITLEDLASKNGTKLGDRIVTSPTGLRDEDRIHVGHVQIVFRVAAAGMSTETLGSHTPPLRRRKT
jgi:DNA-binding winged helix-turn-helix (wHTH) protein